MPGGKRSLALCDAKRFDAHVLGIEQFARTANFKVESFVGCCSGDLDNQSIGIVECEFSVEFCSSGKHYVGWE